MSVTQGFIVVITLPVAVAGMFFSDYLMRIYWKTQSTESVPLIGCMLSALIQGLGGATGPAISAMGRMWLGFLLNLIWGFLCIAIVAWCAAKMGAAAVTFGQAIAYVFLASMTFLYLRRSLPKGMLPRFFMGLGMACLVTILALVVPGAWRIWLGIPIVVCVSICGVRWFLGSEIQSVLGRGRPSTDQETISPCH
jgi:O-antigen/teichoic acid export membrane protein